MKKTIIGYQSVIVNAIFYMSANPTLFKADYPGMESAKANVIFILNKTKFLLIIFLYF